ncbi:hypothetical protein HYT23_03945 [Candidatus Pacearchaeota archaeon]|nr:hypothetical protein [Candidatus Pacearchaeota archaeon]
MSSNNSALLVFAIVVLVLALGNLVVTIDKVGTLTGRASDTATAALELAPAAQIDFIVDSINWGSGAVDEAPTKANINSEGAVIGGNWTAVSQGLTLQNNGNVDVTLSLTTSNVASAFIGGSAGGGPKYELKVSNSEASSCEVPLNSTNLGTYTEATGTAQATCKKFDKTDASDLLRIDVNLTIPEDADPGAKSSTITATAIVFTP